MYTNISKPGVQTWTNTNTAKPSFDDASIAYDNTSTFYDGYNPSQYTNVAKPSTSWTNISKPT